MGSRPTLARYPTAVAIPPTRLEVRANAINIVRPARIVRMVPFMLGLFALLFAPVADAAQQADKVYRVGFVLTASPISELVGPAPINPAARAFVQGLHSLGYIEGQNFDPGASYGRGALRPIRRDRR
jgi:hypothetical protein